MAGKKCVRLRREDAGELEKNCFVCILPTLHELFAPEKRKQKDVGSRCRD